MWFFVILYIIALIWMINNLYTYNVYGGGRFYGNLTSAWRAYGVLSAATVITSVIEYLNNYGYLLIVSLFLWIGTSIATFFIYLFASKILDYAKLKCLVLAVGILISGIVLSVASLLIGYLLLIGFLVIYFVINSSMRGARKEARKEAKKLYNSSKSSSSYQDQQYEKMVKWFDDHPGAGPSDYPG